MQPARSSLLFTDCLFSLPPSSSHHTLSLAPIPFPWIRSTNSSRTPPPLPSYLHMRIIANAELPFTINFIKSFNPLSPSPVSSSCLFFSFFVCARVCVFNFILFPFLPFSMCRWFLYTPYPRDPPYLNNGFSKSRFRTDHRGRDGCASTCEHISHGPSAFIHASNFPFNSFLFVSLFRAEEREISYSFCVRAFMAYDLILNVSIFHIRVIVYKLIYSSNFPFITFPPVCFLCLEQRGSLDTDICES